MLIIKPTVLPQLSLAATTIILAALSAGCAAPSVRSPTAAYPAVVPAADAPSQYLVCADSRCAPKSPTPKTGIPPVPAVDPSVRTAVATELNRVLQERSAEAPRLAAATPPQTTTRLFTIAMPLSDARIGPAARAGLREFLASIPTDRPVTFLAAGRTDDTGSMTTNVPLALRRAQLVKQALLAERPTAMVQLEATAMCCYIASNETRAGRVHNRRAELTATF